MRISELKLSNLVKHFLIREFKERGVDAMCVKEFLPLCAALLYPYAGYEILVDNKNTSTIIPILESVRHFCEERTNLGNYTLSGLRSYFQHNWLNTLSVNKQISLIKSISLIESVEESGFFSINGNEL